MIKITWIYLKKFSCIKNAPACMITSCEDLETVNGIGGNNV